MSNGNTTEGNPPAISTQGNDGAGQTDQGNHGNQSDNSAGASHAPIQMPDFGPVMTAIAALPEQIAKSVKEAVGTPAKPPASKPESDSSGSNGSEGATGTGSASTGTSKPTSGTSAPSGEPGKRKGLADWWFNG